MAVGYTKLPELLPVPGIRLGATCAGIRYQDRRDLVVMEIAEGSNVAGVFTRNAFCAAPVVVAKEHMAATAPRYLLVNTGNANAGTGAQGLADARRCCELVARQVGAEPQAVLPFSTGVIGESLPMDIIEQGVPAALAVLSEQGWADAAQGIMTTDTVAKGMSKRIDVDGQTVTVTGIAKGAGMIRPDMATMLAYIATDAAVAPDLLQGLLVQAVEHSFNRITVDGDTSTNDACMLIATAQSGVDIQVAGTALDALSAAVTEICTQLAQLLIRDAEGATKFVSVRVSGGKDADECLQVAYTVAHSPLVKTALFASDPNWGRILATVGRAGLDDLNLDAIEIHLGDVCIVSGGSRAGAYQEEDGQRVMDQEEIEVEIRLGRGVAEETVWTSDLSHEYVRINAEYRS